MPWLSTRVQDLKDDSRVEEFPRAFTTMLFDYPADKRRCYQREYRYNLDDCDLPPKQNDPVIALIIRTIRSLARENMYVAATNIRVHNATNGPPLWPVNLQNAQCNVKFYTFKTRFEEFPMTVPISLTDRTRRLHPGHIVVRVGGKWKQLESWLLELPRYELLVETPEMAILTQQAWWRCNGKVFRLMELPVEVRLVVLQHVLGETIYTRTKWITSRSDTLALGYGSDEEPADLYHTYEYIKDKNARARKKRIAYQIYGSRPPILGILLANRQVRAEALRVGWEGTWKVFNESIGIEQVALCSNVPSGYNWMSRLELDFSAYRYFKLFGAEIDPHVHINVSQSKGSLFRSFSGLKQLRIRFDSPYDSEQNNPWHSYVSLNNYHDWFREDPNYAAMSRWPCQRALVEYILTFAFPHIKRIPTIRLAGYIKSAQKAKWDYIFAKDYLQRKENYRTHGFDATAELSQIAQIPVWATPECNCPLTCKLDKIPLPWLRDSDVFDYDDAFTPELVEQRKKLPEEHPYQTQLFDVSAAEVEVAIEEAKSWDIVEQHVAQLEICERLTCEAEPAEPVEPDGHGFRAAGLLDYFPGFDDKYGFDSPPFFPAHPCWMMAGNVGKALDQRHRGRGRLARGGGFRHQYNLQRKYNVDDEELEKRLDDLYPHSAHARFDLGVRNEFWYKKEDRVGLK